MGVGLSQDEYAREQDDWLERVDKWRERWEEERALKEHAEGEVQDAA